MEVPRLRLELDAADGAFLYQLLDEVPLTGTENKQRGARVQQTLTLAAQAAKAEAEAEGTAAAPGPSDAPE